MTTAQERRRARRLARARAAGVAPVEVVDVVEVDAHASEALVERAADPTTRPIEDARATFGRVAVEPADDSVPAHPRRAVDHSQPAGTLKHWVAVPARRSAPASPPSPPTLPAQPREEREQEHERDAHEATSAAPLNPPVRRALHPKTRAIRITRVKTNGRRRWSVDFLVRQPDMHLPK